ncbi:cytochrome P450 family protein [Streptacidiphilus pinicola]|uniref:cytochrome P450 family protein n=1 Tax=Streptacidiphilus pinicola TaxID=2219663 RepID=UPI001FB2B5D2|nr:cytochrome P450 [Streptacidiphilus pinicola]
MWLVTRYDDVRALLNDPRLSLNKATASSSGEHGASMPAELDAHLQNSDPPDHTRLRRLVSKAFTPRGIEGLRPLVERRVDDLVARLEAGESTDLIQAVANPLALAVICDVLGIDEGDRRDFRRWTDALRSPEPDAALDSRQALKQMYGFLSELINRKRADDPGDDLLSQMVAARDEEDRLTEAELVAMAFLLLFAGYDNSANLIGSAMLALLTHPQVLRALRAGTVSMDQVLDETLRWETPSMLASRRFARERIDFGGQVIAPGDRVWLSLVSANRDAAQFAQPHEFQATRSGNGHLAFGHGLHYCVGAALARMEASVAIHALLRSLPEIRLACAASELRWTSSFRTRGLVALPVAW